MVGSCAESPFIEERQELGVRTDVARADEGPSVQDDELPLSLLDVSNAQLQLRTRAEACRARDVEAARSTRRFVQCNGKHAAIANVQGSDAGAFLHAKGALLDSHSDAGCVAQLRLEHRG